jgi:HSP20 family protein
MSRKDPQRSSWSFPMLRFPSFLDEREEEGWPEHFSEPSGLSVFEDEKHVTIEAAVPGLEPSDIDMTFEKGILWIKGEKKETTQDQSKKYYRKALNVFSYRIAVPGNIDEDQAPDATYKLGVLRVVFTKALSSKPKKIVIKNLTP